MNALPLATIKEISPKLQGLTIIIDLGSSSVKAGFAQENGMALFIYFYIFNNRFVFCNLLLQTKDKARAKIVFARVLKKWPETQCLVWN